MQTTYLVTGANRGLGLEFVRQLRARGDRVFAGARSPKNAGALRELTPDVLALDVASEEGIASLASALKGQPIDVLINNAGVFGEDPTLGALSMSEFQRVFGANVFGPALLVRALIANLDAGKRKVVANVSSQLGSISQSGSGFSWSYRSSKAALNMVSVAMHQELSGRGYTCVALCPGWNRTDMGGKEAPLEPADSIRSLVKLIDGLTAARSGKFLDREGAEIPW